MAFQGPVLVVRGEQSDLLSRETVTKMVEAGRAVSSVEIAGVGHAPAFLTVDQIAEQALARWVIPRAMRDSSYRTWSPNDTYAEICAPCRSFADTVQSVDQQEQGANRAPAN